VLEEAANESDRAFGDRAMIVERYIERPRHVEVQIVGDRHGGVIHLGTRECSVQRRYQKLLEEAPAPNLPDTTREQLHDAAVLLSKAIGYDSAGTVEFIVDDASGEWYFLEMNTRLQVEHPVTEAVTGLDIVELQIRVAEGEPLPLSQRAVTFRGHSFEARINAEDPATGIRAPARHDFASPGAAGRPMGQCDRRREHDHPALRPHGREADRARRGPRDRSPPARRGTRSARRRWAHDEHRVPTLGDRAGAGRRRPGHHPFRRRDRPSRATGSRPRGGCHRVDDGGAIAPRRRRTRGMGGTRSSAHHAACRERAPCAPGTER
jgi:hypothetical protein